MLAGVWYSRHHSRAHGLGTRGTVDFLCIWLWAGSIRQPVTVASQDSVHAFCFHSAQRLAPHGTTRQGRHSRLYVPGDPRSCEGALKRLQRPAIDLFVYRGPPPADGPSIEETMEECKVRACERHVLRHAYRYLSPATYCQPWKGARCAAASARCTKSRTVGRRSN